MAHQRVRTNVTQAGAAAASGNFEDKLDITDDAAVAFTATKIPSGCVAALCTLETNDIRFTTDGTTPTQAIGHLVYYPAMFYIRGENDIKKFKCIACVGTTHADLTITYEQEA